MHSLPNKPESDISSWLTQFFGLAYLDPSEVGDCIDEELVADIPDDQRCLKFADYVVENYISPDSTFQLPMWSAQPSAEAKRTTNGAESFHAHFNEQFYSAHPCIFVFLDNLLKIQTTTYIKVRCLEIPAVMRRSEKEKIDYLMVQFAKLQNGESDRQHFLKAIGFKFSARTDL